MRILNEELKKNIIDKAIIEFCNHGYQKSSLRKIVKEAGTTIGNFYNYFKSKEELYYSIVEPVYSNIVYFMEHHKEENEFDENTPLDFNSVRFIIKVFLERFVPFEKPFVVLLTASEGTKYENIWDMLIDVFSVHLKEHIDESPVYSNMNIKPVLTKSLSHGFLHGALFILKTDESTEEKLEQLTDFVIMYFVGMLGILKP